MMLIPHLRITLTTVVISWLRCISVADERSYRPEEKVSAHPGEKRGLAQKWLLDKIRIQALLYVVDLSSY